MKNKLYVLYFTKHSKFEYTIDLVNVYNYSQDNYMYYLCGLYLDFSCRGYMQE